MKELLVNDFVTLTAAALGLLINCATFVALLLNRHRLSAKAHLVLSLTLGSIVTVAGSMLHTLYNEHAIGGMQCLSRIQVLMHDVKYVGIILTVLGLNALCVDLYLAVMHSMRYRVLCRKGRVRILICVKWLASTLLGCVSSISHLLAGMQQNQQQCSTPKDVNPALTMLTSVANQPTNRTGNRVTVAVAKEPRPTLFVISTNTTQLLPLPPPPLLSFDFLMQRLYISDCVLLAVLAVSVLFITASLARIYCKLRNRVRRNYGGNLRTAETNGGGNRAASATATTPAAQATGGGGGSIGMRRHSSVSGSRAKRRGAFTILMLFLGFNATVLPYMVGELYAILMISASQANERDGHADLVFIHYTLPYLAALAVSYTVLNPVVISLRMREVQAGYVIMCRRWCRKPRPMGTMAMRGGRSPQTNQEITPNGDNNQRHRGDRGYRLRQESCSMRSNHSPSRVSFGGGGGTSYARGYSDYQDTNIE